MLKKIQIINRMQTKGQKTAVYQKSANGNCTKITIIHLKNAFIRLF